MPRRFVVVDALPRDPNGKLRRAAALALLRSDSADPPNAGIDLVAVGTPSANERRFEVRVPEDLVFFEGHFAGRPVLPGAVELDLLARKPAVEAWPDLGQLREVPRLKLKNPVAPGDRLQLVLRRSGHEVTFELGRDGTSCAAGTLRFSGPTSG